MSIEAFVPEVDSQHKYAVAVPAGGGNVFPIKSYETLEQLREGIATWRQYALQRDITIPVPIELIDNTGKCKVLTDLIQTQLAD